jgi:hypothetical protein
MLEEKNMSDIHVTGPIGKAIADSGIENYMEIMAVKWDESKSSSKWWQLWKKVSFIAITNFLLARLDDLISYVDNLVASGIDKKATVLDALTRIYDKIIYEAMPIWLKPFSPLIRVIVIGQIIPAAIDFFVSKYREGSWNKKDPEVVAQLFGVPGDHRPS